jgi:para-nitrobenzyl esterase
MHRIIAELRGTILLGLLLHPAAAIQNPVRTDSGLLSGTDGANRQVTVFKGVPYAAPPVGQLRWRAPRPPIAWQGVRKADHFSNSCMQAGNTLDEINAAVKERRSPFSPEFYSWREPRSEDCLYLNVWTAAKSPTERLPVLVWLHGGGFMQGAGSLPIYDGEGLAEKGLVVVTINYRLGIFGFFTHPELTRESDRQASGNYGLMDQIAALEWVRRNIAAFGGDPNNVTIDGQSAGAHSVNYLVASPAAKGLFQKAISQSGGMFAPCVPGAAGLSSGQTPRLKDLEQTGLQFAQKMHAASLAELRAKPAAELLQAGAQFRPVIDGYVVPADLYTIFAEGRQNDVPTVAGWNSGDGTPFARNSQMPDTAAAYLQEAHTRFGALAEQFLSIFPVTADQDTLRVRPAIARDMMFAWQTRTWGRLQSKTGKSKIYLYYFDLIPPGRRDLAIFGAHHSAEIVYALNNLRTWDLPWTETDRKLAAAMSSYWVNFARSGDPNSKTLAAWPAFAAGREQSMLFGSKTEPIPTPQKIELDFFDAWFARQRESR